MQLWHVFTHEDRAPLFRETFFQLCQTLENQLQEIQGQCLGAIPVEYENVSGAMSTLKTKKLGMRFGAGGGGGGSTKFRFRGAGTTVGFNACWNYL